MPESPSASGAPSPSPHSQLFTVRVWREDLGEGRSEWRGQVQHVLSGPARYFRDWHTLETFIVESAALARRETWTGSASRGRGG